MFKCESVEEVRAAFDKINGAINGLGLVNEVSGEGLGTLRGRTTVGWKLGGGVERGEG